MSGERVPSLDQLRAEARYARERLALYRRRTLLGRGEPRRLAELERIADGAAKRLRRAEADASGGRPEGQGAPPTSSNGNAS